MPGQEKVFASLRVLQQKDRVPHIFFVLRSVPSPGPVFDVGQRQGGMSDSNPARRENAAPLPREHRPRTFAQGQVLARHGFLEAGNEARGFEARGFHSGCWKRMKESWLNFLDTAHSIEQ
jgi:hypothetical protein